MSEKKYIFTNSYIVGQPQKKPIINQDKHVDINKNDGWGDFDPKKNDGWGDFNVKQPPKKTPNQNIINPNINIIPPKIHGNTPQNVHGNIPQNVHGKPVDNKNNLPKQPQNPPDSKSRLKLKQNIKEAIVTQKPNVKWDDVAGLQNAKIALKEAVILPIKHPEIFIGARKPWKGILLYGPPGTGKTFLAKACATETKATFFSVSSSDLMSKYVGQSQKLIKQLFNMARQKKPSIIFIDEIDSMCGNRTQGENEATRRVKTQFMVQMQGVGKDDQGVLVLGATNLPESLDPAMRRRFQKRIYISLPEKQARYKMLTHGLADNVHELTPQNFKYFAEHTEGFSGSDIAILIQDAVYQPIRFFETATKFRKLKNGKYSPCEDNYTGSDAIKMSWQQIPEGQIDVPPVTFKSMQSSLKKVKPTVSKEQLKKYEQFTKQFGQDG